MIVSQHHPQKVPSETSDTGTTPLHDGQSIVPHAASSAVKVADEVAKGVRSAVDGAVTWAGKKVAKLSSEKDDGTGPYESPATCAPSDLDAIGAGILPAMPATEMSNNCKSRHGSSDKSGKDGDEK